MATYNVSTPLPPLRFVKKNWLIAWAVGNPGNAVIVCPPVVGVPVPTVPTLIVPAPEETYSWPENMLTARRFVTVVETVVLVLLPADAATTPVLEPTAQTFVPSVAAERILPVLNPVLPRVVYDCCVPLALSSVIARGTVVAEVAATEAVGIGAL